MQVMRSLSFSMYNNRRYTISVCSITNMLWGVERKKYVCFAREKSMYIYALDGSKHIMLILKIEV